MEKRNAIIYFQNLVAIAMADNELCESELSVLNKIAERLCLSNVEMSPILSNGAFLDFAPPIQKEERIDLLKDMIDVVFADGKVTGSELERCYFICYRLNLQDAYLEDALADKYFEIKG